jgi:AcrR family transcriptional regulator
MADRELEREDWVATARKVLIAEGVAAVRIERLANVLGVTRGGFYWRFRNLSELHQALIEDWRENNTASLLAAVASKGELAERFDRVVRVWIQERDFSPAWDSAMREWARVDAAVATVVHAVDDQRIEALQAMFADAGLAPDAALVRARVLYYHQVGYYALGVRETMARRLKLLPYYRAILTGLGADALLTPEAKPKASARG